MQSEAPAAYDGLAGRLGLTEEERADWRNKAEHMKIPRDAQTGVYEEHDGFSICRISISMRFRSANFRCIRIGRTIACTGTI
ncbi:hypothetical protein HMSSN036_95110 [Paenibacillus macerans]|nr:hypothetical protein HMSSN036_95110 [Paenibacillus macerans]